MNLFRRWVEARVASLCQAVLPGEGAAGGGRLGRGMVAGSLVAPPWLKPCAYAWVGSGGGCQEARGDPAPGQIGRRRPTFLNLHGQGGGQGGKAAQLRHFSGEPPCTSSLYRGNI